MKSRVINVTVLVSIITGLAVPTCLYGQYGYGQQTNWSALYILLLVILWLICCGLVSEAYRNKGLSGAGGFFISFFFSPLIGILCGILKLMPSKEKTAKDDKAKQPSAQDILNQSHKGKKEEW